MRKSDYRIVAEALGKGLFRIGLRERWDLQRLEKVGDELYEIVWQDLKRKADPSDRRWAEQGLGESDDAWCGVANGYYDHYAAQLALQDTNGTGRTVRVRLADGTVQEVPEALSGIRRTQEPPVPGTPLDQIPDIPADGTDDDEWGGDDEDEDSDDDED